MQCQRIFQTTAPITSICLHPNQCELILGDQSGLLHIWDLKTDHSEQLVSVKSTLMQFFSLNFLPVLTFHKFRYLKLMPSYNV